ncbi:MAG: hypothetical protein ABID54_07750 [Pseudomonadota bacterium]
MRGRIIAPQKNHRRVISAVSKRDTENLSLDTYRITHLITPEGRGATIISGDLRCEVSFHRHENGDFYIGSARRRLGEPACTERFLNFLQAAGITTPGMLVELEFDEYEIYVSQI